MVAQGPPAVQSLAQARARYAGLRMSADDFLDLKDDGFRYELVNGVVLMSPSPGFPHQRVARRICQHIGNFVDSTGAGEVVYETDVRLDASLVYRPDIAFYTAERVKTMGKRLIGPPDLVVECLSPDYEAYDLRTKRDDYERFGVREYWVVDPDTFEAHVFVLRDGKFGDPAVTSGAVASVVLAGLVVDLAAIGRSLGVG